MLLSIINRMKNAYLIFLVFVLNFSLLANPAKKSEEMCSCLKIAKASNLDKDKKKCLTLREKHVKALKKGSADYDTYLKSLTVCENQMSDAKPIDPNLSFEEKVAEVCDCFKTSAKSQRMLCFKLQSDYGKTIEDPEKKKEFNLSTSSCDQ